MFGTFIDKISSPCRKKDILKKNKKDKTENLDQLLTDKKAKFGPVFDSIAHTHIYIYIYVYACAVRLGSVQF